MVKAYELLQDESILIAAKHFVDHLISEVGPEVVDIVKTGNFYGLPSSSILQPIVKLYRATGEPVHTWFPGTDPYRWALGTFHSAPRYLFLA